MLTRFINFLTSAINGSGTKRGGDNSDWDFKDLVRDPELARHVLGGDGFDPDKVSNEEIHRMIDDLQDEEFRHSCAHWLTQLKPRSTAAAISRIDEESLTLIVDEFYFPLADLIPEVTGLSHPAVIKRLHELATDPRAHLRRLAGRTLAMSGRDDAVVKLTLLLEDKEEEVRQGVIHGLEVMDDESTRSESFVSTLYPLVRAMIGVRGVDHGDPAEALLKLDPKHAIKDLSQAGLWAHDAPEGTDLVNAFSALDLRPPVESLTERVRWFAEHSGDSKNDYDFYRSLELLGIHAPEQAKAFIETANNHTNERVREAGATVRGRVAGIMPPSDKIYDLYKQDPDRELDGPQQVISTLCEIDGEVGNGGFEQYLWNSTADDWPKHRAALNTIGARQHMAILDRVTDLFGGQGPPTDRSRRHKPLARVAKANGKIIYDCETQWYALSEVLDRLQIEYALKHPESFRPEKAKDGSESS